jgi:hypothetical protein
MLPIATGENRYMRAKTLGAAIRRHRVVCVNRLSPSSEGLGGSTWSALSLVVKSVPPVFRICRFKTLMNLGAAPGPFRRTFPPTIGIYRTCHYKRRINWQKSAQQRHWRRNSQFRRIPCGLSWIARSGRGFDFLRISAVFGSDDQAHAIESTDGRPGSASRRSRCP